MNTTTLTSQQLLTQILTNVEQGLNDLRRQIAEADLRSTPDVRPHHPAGHLLEGIEEPVTYSQLVDLIADIRLGLASRRLQPTASPQQVQALPATLAKARYVSRKVRSL